MQSPYAHPLRRGGNHTYSQPHHGTRRPVAHSLQPVARLVSQHPRGQGYLARSSRNRLCFPQGALELLVVSATPLPIEILPLRRAQAPERHRRDSRPRRGLLSRGFGVAVLVRRRALVLHRLHLTAPPARNLPGVVMQRCMHPWQTLSLDERLMDIKGARTFRLGRHLLSWIHADTEAATRSVPRSGASLTPAEDLPSRCVLYLGNAATALVDGRQVLSISPLCCCSPVAYRCGF